ncbi:MAG TPA: MFS transporter [Micromonosporaceae bacterium]|nr:MFS transporter [Micromonosporaceae bacterium]
MTSTQTETEHARPARGHAWLVLSLVCACQFMVILDVSIVNVALPSVQRELGFSDTDLAWVVNGYVLTFAGFMLLGGRAVDLLGHRRMLVSGLLVFSLTSLLAGVARAPEVLIGARFAQGMGAAMLAPATLAVVSMSFAGELDRAKAFGAWSAAGGVGGMVGALAGGVLTTGLSWRWVFLINVPLGAALIGLAFVSLSGTRVGQREPVDLAGAVTGTAGLATVIYGVMQAADGWGSVRVLGPILAGLVMLVLFVVVEARLATQPMMPLGSFRIPGVAVSNAMLLLFGGIAIAMWFFTSLFMQNVLGYSAIEAGLGQTPAAVMFVVVARFAPGWIPRIGSRALVLAGSMCLVAGFGWLSQADAGGSYGSAVLGPTLLVAVGIGVVFPTLMAAATADVPPSDAGVFAGLANTASQVGGSVALAVFATVASARATAEGTGNSPAALAAGYSLVFLMAVGVGLALAAVSLLLPRHRHS